MTSNKNTTKKAIVYVTNFLERNDWVVSDVQYGNKHNGYDLIARKNRKNIKIEVKGTTVEYGIPDCYETEFNDGRLVATHMYIVSFYNKDKPKLFIVPRKAFKPEYLRVKMGYRIKPKFKKEILPLYEQKS